LLSHNNLSQESKNEYVTIINSCCNNLLDVINDILENTEDGFSDFVIEKICTQLCECEFNEEILLKCLKH